MASPHTEEPPTKGTADPDAHIYEEVTLCERMELSQRLAVEELITTEASYVHNLQLCLSDIRAHLQQKQVRGAVGTFAEAGDCRVSPSRVVGHPNPGKASAEHSCEVTACSPCSPSLPRCLHQPRSSVGQSSGLTQYSHPKALTGTFVMLERPHCPAWEQNQLSVSPNASWNGAFPAPQMSCEAAGRTLVLGRVGVTLGCKIHLHLIYLACSGATLFPSAA